MLLLAAVSLAATVFAAMKDANVGGGGAQWFFPGSAFAAATADGVFAVVRVGAAGAGLMWRC